LTHECEACTRRNALTLHIGHDRARGLSRCTNRGAYADANNGANRVTHMVDGAGVLDRKYGPLGELTEETRTSAAQG